LKRILVNSLNFLILREDSGITFSRILVQKTLNFN